MNNLENNKKVAFFTLGCKVNQYETNGMIQKFEEAGYEIVEFLDKADIYVVNTCTVTNISDRKSRQFLRQAKKNNPEGIIVAVRMLCSNCQRGGFKDSRNRYLFRN